MGNINYYRALRIPSTATRKEIQAAYKKMAVLFNPDSKNETSKQVGEIVQEAFMVLSNPERRAYYDIETLADKQAITDDAISPAEKLINSWQFTYTVEEQEYLDKIATLNRIVKGVIAIGAIFFVWSLIFLRFDFLAVMVFGLALLLKIVRSIYMIKNPPPALKL